ncbi:hypothetical protein RHSIM_Rhsim04G0064000 [Rhododendron simsii]|uniref:Uncharacterized protein n=1 Tax=Rhododendron simsii TaxID=118357 RepID=A0A834LM60_RHOSS|nr:hypothetical protein RHSIM_Rhsim04G0064000 [Rhododendron simsii]
MDNRLLSYDIGTKALVDTGIRGWPISFHFEPFVESLVLVENKNGVVDGQLNPFFKVCEPLPRADLELVIYIEEAAQPANLKMVTSDLGSTGMVDHRVYVLQLLNTDNTLSWRIVAGYQLCPLEYSAASLLHNAGARKECFGLIRFIDEMLALGVGENGKVLLSTRDELLLSSGDNRLLSYDTVTKAVTDTKIRGCSSEFRVEPFMETLVSVESRASRALKFKPLPIADLEHVKYCIKHAPTSFVLSA